MDENSKKHISYKEYQKKSVKNSNEGIVIFVSAFFILLLVFLGIAKQISPNIDVSIGGDATVQEEEDTLGITKSSVDERLKLLQMEDARLEEETFSPELDEKVVLPNKEEVKPQEQSTVKLPQSVLDIKNDVVSKVEHKTEPKAEPLTAPVVQTSAKVVVGSYATREQAEVVKGIIAESGLSITPFVRSIGGVYTIQVGSFSTREKAQTAVDDLIRNNYPARIIVE